MGGIRLSIGLVMAGMLIQGCTALPRSGPEDKSIEAGAAVKVKSSTGSVGINYMLVDINRSVLSYFAEAAAPVTPPAQFGAKYLRAPSAPFGIGDIVSVAIFESQAGGLFIPAEAGSRAGNFITLPNQTIGEDGYISVPYAGRIRAAGRTSMQVKADIEAALQSRAIEPQAVVSLVSSKSREVAVLGDVNQPAKIELTANGDRVMDAIASAGGLSKPGVETYVTLQRRGAKVLLKFSDLVANPADNIYLLPGDVVYVNRERRTFMAFGATGLSGRFDFDESNLTLGEALGKMGGLLDDRADPATVVVYRAEQKSLVDRMGLKTAGFQGPTVPVIYRANLRDPAAFFAMQQFPMQDKDIVYVSTASSVELTKFLDIVNRVTATTANVPNDLRSAKEAVRNF